MLPNIGVVLLAITPISRQVRQFVYLARTAAIHAKLARLRPFDYNRLFRSG